jgi:hypothetical protein
MEKLNVPIVAQGPHSIEAIIADEVKHLTVARSGDCEHVTIWINNDCYLVTAFINSANEPQIRIEKPMISKDMLENLN